MYFEPLNKAYWIPDVLLIVIHWENYQICAHCFIANKQHSLDRGVVKFS